MVEFTNDGETRQEFSILFAGRPVGGVVTTSPESSEVAWLDRNGLTELPMTPAQRRRIRHVLDFNGTPYLE